METKEINGKFYQRKNLKFYSYPMWMEVPKPKVEEVKPIKSKRTKKNTKKED